MGCFPRNIQLQMVNVFMLVLYWIYLFNSNVRICLSIHITYVYMYFPANYMYTYVRTNLLRTYIYIYPYVTRSFIRYRIHSCIILILLLPLLLLVHSFYYGAIKVNVVYLVNYCSELKFNLSFVHVLPSIHSTVIIFWFNARTT